MAHVSTQSKNMLDKATLFFLWNFFVILMSDGDIRQFSWLKWGSELMASEKVFQGLLLAHVTP